MMQISAIGLGFGVYFLYFLGMNDLKKKIGKLHPGHSKEFNGTLMSCMVT